MEPTSQLESRFPTSEQALEDQLREMYGRVAYTHKTHEKMADRYIARYKFIKTIEIVLSAVTAGSLLLAVFGDSHIGTVLGAFLSTILLGLTLYFKEGTLGEQSQKHTVVASKHWGIRERLLSLLVDMRTGVEMDAIRQNRDTINRELEAIYKNAPRTTPRAYAAAQKALKEAEELYFSEDELDHLLPQKLRATSDK